MTYLLFDDPETPEHASNSANLKEIQNQVEALEFGIDRLSSYAWYEKLIPG
jgi:hypothetical protein